MLFLIFVYIDLGQQVFIIKEVFGQCFSQFCFIYIGSFQEQEGIDGVVFVVQIGMVMVYGIGNGFYVFVLFDDLFVQVFFQVKEFFVFVLQYMCYWYVCLVVDDFCDIFCIYFFFDQQFVVGLYVLQVLCVIFQLLFDFRNVAIVDFGSIGVIVFLFCMGVFLFQVFDFFFGLLYIKDDFLFIFLLCFQCIVVFFEVSQFFVDIVDFKFVVFLVYGFLFNFELMDLVFYFVEFFGYGVYFQLEFGSSFVYQVNGFIW